MRRACGTFFARAACPKVFPPLAVNDNEVCHPARMAEIEPHHPVSCAGEQGEYAMATLSVNTDFSSELLLNRIMNGQMKTDTGKTVTAGTRSTAAKLDATALSLGVSAAAVGSAKTIAQGTQSALTEVVAQLKSLRDQLASPTADKSTIAGTYTANLTALLGTTVDGVAVLGNAGKAVDLGAGSGTFTVGKVNLANQTNYGLLQTALGTPATLTTTLVDNAIKEVNTLLSVEGGKYSLLANRVDMLNDLTTTYQTASDDQAVSTGGSASSLLNALG